MSKKSAGEGIMRLLFGLGKKEMKVIPYNQMTSEQFEQLDRFLGKVGFAVAGDSITLTKKQGEYVINQIRQLDLYRKNIMSSKNPDFTDFIPREQLGIPKKDAAEFKGFEPKVIEGGKGKTKPGSKIDYDKMEEFLGVKLRGDETFEELLEIERKNKIKKFEQDNDRALEDLVDDAGGTKEGAEFDDEPFDAAGGGLVSLIERLRRKFGKKAITTADKIDLPAKSKLKNQFKAFEKRNRQLTDEDIEDYELELGDAETWYESGMTVADAEKLVANRKAYEAQMLVDYKAGRLDPKRGEPGRREYLERKLQEAEMSGDSRLIDPDELDELTDIEFRERTMNAEGGIATMFRPKREKFIFGGGVGLKGYLKMLAEGRKTRKGKPMKGSDVLGQGNPKSQVPPAARPFISDRDKSEMKRLRIAQLENVLEGLKEDRKFLLSYEKMANLFPEVNKLSYNMMDDFLGPKHKERFKGLTTEMLDKEILQIENVLKNLKVGKDKRALNADGGRIGFDKGGIFGSGSVPSDVIDSDLLDIGFDNLTLDEIRDILNSIGVDKKADGGLATMFRPKLKDGGPPNPGRRTFMKLMAGLASIPIVGKIFKPAATVSKVVPLKNTTTVMPDWFPSFVDKMVTKNVGNKIDADVMLYKDKELPGVEVYKYDDGRIEVQGKNGYDAEYDINYTPPGYEVIDPVKGKVVKTPGDFEANDTVYRMTDPDGGFDADGEVVDKIDDILGGNSTQLEGYAKGTGEVKYTPGQRRIDEAEAIGDRADDVTPYKDVDPTDFAKGGLATMFRKK